jgi:hypothetical protein
MRPRREAAGQADLQDGLAALLQQPLRARQPQREVVARGQRVQVLLEQPLQLTARHAHQPRHLLGGQRLGEVGLHQRQRLGQLGAARAALLAVAGALALVARPQALQAQRLGKHDDAGHGRGDRLHTFQRRGDAGRRGGGGVALHMAGVLQEGQQRVGILLGQRLRHLGLAAQLHGGGQAAQRVDGEAAAEVRGQLPPDARDGLVEGLVARHLGHQQRLRAQPGGQRREGRGLRRGRVDVHDGLVVAVQVQHEVGIDRQALQQPLQRLGGVGRLPGLQQRRAGRADGAGVGLAVRPQLCRQLRDQVCGQMLEAAVEVQARGKVEAAEGTALQVLRQRLRDEHGRHLVGMQRRLQVGLAAGHAAAEMQAAQAVGGAGAGGRQVVDQRSHRGQRRQGAVMGVSKGVATRTGCTSSRAFSTV